MLIRSQLRPECGWSVSATASAVFRSPDGPRNQLLRRQAPLVVDSKPGLATRLPGSSATPRAAMDNMATTSAKRVRVLFIAIAISKYMGV